mgnify:FL=1
MRVAKKILLLLAAFAFCLGLSLMASADDDGVFSYRKTEDASGVVVIGYTGTDRSVTVPDKLAGLPVVEIGAGAFRNQSALVTVVLPDMVEKIGDTAFAGCLSLTQISLPASLTEIGAFAFDDCAALVLTGTVGSAAYDYVRRFGGKISLTETPEEPYVYSMRGDFLTLHTYNGVGGRLVLPAKLNVPGAGPRYVAYLDADAFRGVRGITSIRISSTIEGIDPNAFAGCAELESIEVDVANEYYKSVDGVLYSKDGRTLIFYPPAKKDAEFVVPEGTTEIAPNAMRQNPYLKKLVLAETTDTLGMYALRDCISLADISVPDGLLFVGVGCVEGTAWLSAQGNGVVCLGKTAYAFRGDTADPMVLPSDIRALASYLFAERTDRTFLLPEGLEVIGASAFFGCGNLERLTLPASVSVVGKYAFEGCLELDDLEFLGEEVSIDRNAFGNDASPAFICAEGSDAFYYARRYGFCVAGVDLRAPVVRILQTRRNSFTIQWEPVEKATGYHVYLYRSGWSSYRRLTTEPLTDPVDLVSKLTSDTSYIVRVTAVDTSDPQNVRESVMSRPLSVKTLNNILGDVNQDGALTLNDMVYTFQILSGSVASDESHRYLADVNGDGQVTLNDMILIFQAVSGQIVLK